VTGLDKRGGEARYHFRPWIFFTLLIPAKIYSILLYGLEERFVFIHGSAEKSTEGCEASIQYLDFLDANQLLHV